MIGVVADETRSIKQSFYVDIVCLSEKLLKIRA